MSDLQAEPLLRRTFPFSTLAEEDRRHLAPAVRVRRYPRGAVLFRQGDPSAFFYTVAEGRIKVVKLTPDGRELILEIFGDGDPLGAVAVYDERPYPATAVALEECVCLEIPRETFFALLAEQPALTRRLLRALTSRLVSLTNRLADLTSGRVEGRFARLFLKLAGERGQPGGGPGEVGVTVPLHLKRQELADLTGTTVETAIRIMRRWHREGVVLTRRDGFVILDPRALEELALT